jgi:acyl-CoA synthetase (AMP-forming)/AMP-acid ligase II
MIVNIAETLSRTAAKNGARTAVIEARGGESCTFAELETYVQRYAAYLKGTGPGGGIEQGERVILMVRPSLDFIALAFALFKIGAPVILIDPGMGYKNLLRCIHRVKPDYLIAIPQVVWLSRLFRKTFKGLKKRYSCGSAYGFAGRDIVRQRNMDRANVETFEPDMNSLAAIIFTTGSTGPPKGVRFEHHIFAAQLELIRSYFKIGSDDVDQPGFPLFALFSTALGACAVIPDMDPTRPAQVDPELFVNSINQYRVTYSFGSPAIWRVVSAYCRRHSIRCPGLKKVLMAGAPVSGALIRDVYRLMAPDAEIYTPYGATESLPIVSIEGREVLSETWQKTREGKGTCVGRPLPGITVQVIEAGDGPIASISDTRACATGEIGEIIVSGTVVSRAYENNEVENRMAKIADGDQFFHRIGDVGYFDEQGRLWFCGRKAHRVFAKGTIMYTICCEAIINNHPDVFRSALVGIDAGKGHQEPVMVVELKPVSAGRADRDKAALLAELRERAVGHRLTRNIRYFLIHPSFPVDIRHNAKIFREQLAAWATEELG